MLLADELKLRFVLIKKTPQKLSKFIISFKDKNNENKTTVTLLEDPKGISILSNTKQRRK
jgi:hypothetical protein